MLLAQLDIPWWAELLLAVLLLMVLYVAFDEDFLLLSKIQA